MRKKTFLIIVLFSLIAVSSPNFKAAQAIGIQQIGFDSIGAQAVEGDFKYPRFITELPLDDSEYIDVYYSVSGTASESDYYFHNGSGVVRVTNTTSLPLYSIDEGGLELDETVVITLQAAVDNDNNQVSLYPGSKVFTLTIKDNNGPPRLSFTNSESTSDENGGGSVTVNLSRASASTVTFEWMFFSAGSTAVDQSSVINGNTFPPDVLIRADVMHTEEIPAGQISIEIPLGIQNDNLYENDETVTLAFGQNITNAVLGSITGHVHVIRKNDVPTISFQPGFSSGSEGLANVNLPVVLSNALPYDVTFTLAVNPINSTARWGGVDWTLPVQVAPLKFLAGATTANAAITIVDDNQQEGNETAVVFIAGNIPEVGDPLEISPNSSYTYTIVDNDTPATPPGTPPGGGNGTTTPPTVPPGVCPSLSPGDMVKVNGKAAIYVVNRFNKIMYFPSGDEFKSWNEGEGYGGYITVTQDCFDNGLSVPTTPPAGINYRPGSHVIRKENSDPLYVILPNNAIAKISVADAKALYGTNFKVMTVKFIFWSNYINTGADISGKAHTGMLVRKDNKVWYVDGNSLREVPNNQLSANRFKTAFIRTVPTSYLNGFVVGAPIDRQIVEYINRTQL